MSFLHALGDRINVRFSPDADGYLGRECPECEGYFKITPGTGLTGDDLTCTCPYCGHSGSPDTFFTRDQIEHAESVAMNAISSALLGELKTLERSVRPRGGFGLGVKVTGSPTPIRQYSERALETELACESCTLKYAIYGLFAFCPDCGAHNSRQILENNLSLVGKILDLADAGDEALRTHLCGNALEDVVAAFDGYGRELCAILSELASSSSKEKVSFQNLERAKKRMAKMFAYDLSSPLTDAEWQTANRGFQKRHLLSHTMGIVDEEYVRSTGDHSMAVGRKVVITRAEVAELADLVRRVATGMETLLRQNERSRA